MGFRPISVEEKIAMVCEVIKKGRISYIGKQVDH